MLKVSLAKACDFSRKLFVVCFSLFMDGLWILLKGRDLRLADSALCGMEKLRSGLSSFIDWFL